MVIRYLIKMVGEFDEKSNNFIEKLDMLVCYYCYCVFMVINWKGERLIFFYSLGGEFFNCLWVYDGLVIFYDIFAW